MFVFWNKKTKQWKATDIVHFSSGNRYVMNLVDDIAKSIEKLQPPQGT